MIPTHLTNHLFKTKVRPSRAKPAQHPNPEDMEPSLNVPSTTNDNPNPDPETQSKANEEEEKEETSTKSKTKNLIKKAVKKISSTAHANFRKLKIKNRGGSNGGGGGSGMRKFGRRRR